MRTLVVVIFNCCVFYGAAARTKADVILLSTDYESGLPIGFPGTDG